MKPSPRPGSPPVWGRIASQAVSLSLTQRTAALSPKLQFACQFSREILHGLSVRKTAIIRAIASMTPPATNQGKAKSAIAYPPVLKPFTQSVTSRPKTMHSTISRPRGSWQFPKSFNQIPKPSDTASPSGTLSHTVTKMIQVLVRPPLTSQAAIAPHIDGKANASNSMLRRLQAHP